MKTHNTWSFVAVAMNCRVSLASEAVPVADSIELCPACEGPKFAQPFPVPAGGLLQGQAVTPFCPGTQKSVPVDCAQADAPRRVAPRAAAILKLFIVHLPLQSSAMSRTRHDRTCVVCVWGRFQLSSRQRSERRARGSA